MADIKDLDTSTIYLMFETFLVLSNLAFLKRQASIANTQDTHSKAEFIQAINRSAILGGVSSLSVYVYNDFYNPQAINTLDQSMFLLCISLSTISASFVAPQIISNVKAIIFRDERAQPGEGYDTQSPRSPLPLSPHQYRVQGRWRSVFDESSSDSENSSGSDGSTLRARVRRFGIKM